MSSGLHASKYGALLSQMQKELWIAAEVIKLGPALILILWRSIYSSGKDSKGIWTRRIRSLAWNSLMYCLFIVSISTLIETHTFVYVPVTYYKNTQRRFPGPVLPPLWMENQSSVSTVPLISSKPVDIISQATDQTRSLPCIRYGDTSVV